MQKGHHQSTVPTLLVALVVLSLSGGLLHAKRIERPVGPLLPVNGVSPTIFNPDARPVIGLQLPTPPIMMRGASKGTGVDADQNLTQTATASHELSPACSPGITQNRIVFSSNGVDENPKDGQIDGGPLPAGADYDLWIMRSDGSEQYRLADLPGDQIEPSYDTGGRLIVYSSQVNGIWQIFTVEVRDTTIITQITSGPGNKRHPTWSPDSNWIAFQCDVDSGEGWNLYKIRADGVGSIIRITSGAPNDTDPAWSPISMDAIAFTRDNGGVKRIYVTSQDGSVVDALSTGNGEADADDQEPCWQADGQYIAFASSRLSGTGDATRDLNIFGMAAQGEANGATVGVVSDRSAANEYDPAITVPISRMPMRVTFVSERSGQADIWSTQSTDDTPPILTALPTVTPRIATPGDDVKISVKVYDRDNQVAQVFAIIKNPDLKVYQQSDAQYFDSLFTAGHRELEFDCLSVDFVELFDDDGDGEFTGEWTTEAVPAGRDYIIDITVLDTAVPGNFLRYDDIYGFSTKTFAPQYNILWVDDYCEGQVFLAQLGWNNNDIGAAFPVESYYTRNPGYHPGTQSSIEYDSIKSGYEAGYDTWRIICRGRVPQSVYQRYLPTIEYQLDPLKLDAEGSIGVTADKPVPVADRCVIWGAPHTGDVWASPGSIVDAATQADVANFVARGGRLFMSGEDIAWALTMNGTRPNTFLTNTLRARFVRDIAVPGRDAYVRYGFLQRRMQQTAAEFGVAGDGVDPVTFDPWVGAGSHASDPSQNTWYDTGDNPTQLNTSRIEPFPTNTPWFNDAAAYSIRPDAIEPQSDAIKIYGAASAEGFGFGGPCVGVRWEDTSSGMGGKVVYLSFGFEQIHRGYHNGHCRNLRSHLLHNFACWSRTGGFQGKVLNIDGGGPINDPAPIVMARQGGVTKYAARCQKDGTYLLQGLPPGHYDIEPARPGFEIDHYEGEFVHGGQIARVVDAMMKRAQPGAITGTVTSVTTGQPLPNVVIRLAPVQGGPLPGLPGGVNTGADGRFTIPSVPAGNYIITADGSSLLYQIVDQDVTVPVGDTVTVNFTLDADDGVLQVAVRDGDTGVGIRNASVFVSGNAGNTTGYTDDNGRVSITLRPGTYNVSASASGYDSSETRTVEITPGATTELNPPFELNQQPGGRIAGRVIAAGSGGFVGDVTIRVFFGDEEIAGTVTQAGVVETINGIQYNYVIDDVPTGGVRVTAERSGFTASPQERYVTIESGKTTTGVNFSLDSLRTFPRGLQLVSFPWDYSTIDPEQLLNIPTGTLRMVTWEAARQRYRTYPAAPADRFRLGQGYWMRLADPADLSMEGVAPGDVVEIPLSAEWNLIGCPFRSRLDFYTAMVRDTTTGLTYTLQQAMGRGMISSGLYAYVLGGYQSVGVLSPYTGYWFRTNMPCTLILDQTAGTLAAGKPEPKVGPQVEDGWLLQLQTSVAGVMDTATQLGQSAKATAGCDFGLDEQKPPLPGMGPYVYTAIDNSSWSQQGGDYAVDVRPADGACTWKLKVYTNQVGKSVTVGWKDLSSLPNSVRPFLVDMKSGKRTYMRTTSGYSFVADRQPRELQVVIESGQIGQLTVTPMAAANSGSGVAITYSLSRSANVSAVITNLAGRVVRSLSASGMQTAGQNTLLWDCRDKAGLQVPAGRYLVTIIGRTETGQESRAVVPLQRSR